MTTLDEVRRYVGKPLGIALCTDDINELACYMDFEDYLKLRLQVDIESAQKAIRWEINQERVTFFQRQIDHAQKLLAQLDLVPTQRDIILHLEIEGFKDYYNRLSR